MTRELIREIEAYLGCGEENKTVLIGAGNLGKALLSYDGFLDYGLNVIAAFDIDPKVVGSCIGTKPVLAMKQLEEICQKHSIKLGIITVPAAAAQTACDELVSYGIEAVWNFAPTVLKVPAGVLVENENLASSLAVLCKHLKTNKGEKQ